MRGEGSISVARPTASRHGKTQQLPEEQLHKDDNHVQNYERHCSRGGHKRCGRALVSGLKDEKVRARAGKLDQSLRMRPAPPRLAIDTPIPRW